LPKPAFRIKEKNSLGLLAALQFLTLLPIKRSFTSEQIGRSTAYFPLVGIIIGLILAGLNYVFNLLLPPSVVNALLVVTLAVLSGGLHLDGLADTMDGIAGHRTPEQRLEIMRDSRIGGFGAIGLALFLILEYVALNSIPAHWMPYTLILAPTLSRWAMVTAIFVYPYARPTGLGRAFKDAVTWQQFAWATMITLVLAVVLFRVAGLAIFAGVWVIMTLVAMHLKHQLKGLTGDTYGAINEVAAVSVMLLVTMLVFKQWLWV
jgi:adenosylcobinamide-GDP ribazoletransferase